LCENQEYYCAYIRYFIVHKSDIIEALASPRPGQVKVQFEVQFEVQGWRPTLVYIN
jgi:hypothetical protein